MSSETLLRDEQGNVYCYETLYTQAWLEGHAPGIDRVAKHILNMASECFARGDDHRAHMLRELSQHVGLSMQAAAITEANEHEKNHPVVVRGLSQLPRSKKEVHTP